MRINVGDWRAEQGEVRWCSEIAVLDRLRQRMHLHVTSQQSTASIRERHTEGGRGGWKKD
jgi:hypothetical protein